VVPLPFVLFFRTFKKFCPLLFLPFLFLFRFGNNNLQSIARGNLFVVTSYKHQELQAFQALLFVVINHPWGMTTFFNVVLFADVVID
jgi:hypothetical protein